MAIQRLSKCCSIPVIRFGDNKMNYYWSCGCCGLKCDITEHDDTPDWMKEQSEEMIERIVNSPFIEPVIERVDFSKAKEFYLEDVKMADSIGSEI